MYMRLMRLKALLGKSEEFCEFYKSEVLAELRRSGGCLFATLTEGLKNPDQFVSLTFWNDLEDIKRYEEESPGRYQALLELTQQFLAESGEWRVQLSDDLTLDYGPSKDLGVGIVGMLPILVGGLLLTFLVDLGQLLARRRDSRFQS